MPQVVQSCGLVLEDVGNPFYSGVTRAVEEIARLRGRQVISGSSDEDPLRERELALEFCSRRVDGLLHFLVQARMEPDKQCILVLIGATPEGKKELLGFTDGARSVAPVLSVPALASAREEVGLARGDDLVSFDRTRALVSREMVTVSTRMGATPAGLRSTRRRRRRALRKRRADEAPLARPPPEFCPLHAALFGHSGFMCPSCPQS